MSANHHRRGVVAAAVVAAVLATASQAQAQDFNLVNFQTGVHTGTHNGARVCFFADGTPLFRASRIASGQILLPEVSMLAGHGGPGGVMATTPGQGFTAAQHAEVYGDYMWRVQQSRQNIGLQMACRSGVPSGTSASQAEQCARMIASPSRCGTALGNTQIGFTGVLSGVPGGRTLSLHQANPLMNNPYGVIAYHGYPTRAGAPSTTACVEARYISDGRPLLQQVCRDGRSCTLVADAAPGAETMGAAGCRAPSGLATAGRICGNVVFIAGTEVLMYQAEEFSRYADELDQASLRGDCVPFNAEACQPWCGDYWQQAGWYYGMCDNPPADPSWAGSPGLPRPGAPHYDEVLGSRLRDGFGRGSHVYRCWQRGLDPAAAGFVEVPVWRTMLVHRRFEDMLRGGGRDCFRPFDEVIVPDIERVPYYLPRGWRARNQPVDCGGRGGRIQQPGGYDPPYAGDGGGCSASGGAGLGASLLALGLMLARRRRSGTASA